jgi:hypothetical protein
MKKALWILSICLLGVLLSDFCHKQTKGFAVSKMTKPFSLSIDLAPENSEEVSLALNQPFYYLKKGRSAFVFESKDKKYVIKFLKSSNIFPPFWTTLSPARFILSSRCKTLTKRMQLKRNEVLTSYKIADESLKEQTGILYSHLETTSFLKKPITLYDNIKVKHSLAADSTAFILQKRADPFHTYFHSLYRAEKKEEMEILLKKFALLLHERALKGIHDFDLSPRYNLGICGEELLTFDLDGLRSCNPPTDSISLQKHMVHDGMKMLIWLEKLHTDLAIFLELEIYKLSLLS